jgi:methionine synthase I (cobalamin-dependent)
MAVGVDKLFAGETVLCDGAMGTMLYSCGVFINRCYDELNVTQPETVRSVHEQYLQAGAEIIETNTFGANSFRLERFGLRDRVAEFNRAGVAIARQTVAALHEKQGTQAYVAGAVGSLGMRLQPEGETTPEAARAAFAEQIEALAGAGADLLILETMMSVAEAEQALLAARQVAPQLKVAVLFTVNDEGNCLDGATPEAAALRMTELGADAVGCNCSTGPLTVLHAVERMHAVTSLTPVCRAMSKAASSI